MLSNEVISHIHRCSDIDARRTLEAAFGFTFIRHALSVVTSRFHLPLLPSTDKEGSAEIVLKINERKQYRISEYSGGFHCVNLSIIGEWGEMYGLNQWENEWHKLPGLDCTGAIDNWNLLHQWNPHSILLDAYAHPSI